MSHKNYKTIIERIEAARKKRQTEGLTPKQISETAATNKRVVSVKRHRPTRPRVAKPSQTVETGCNFSVFFSGGIGDVLALESFFSEEQRNCLKAVYYGTNKQAGVEAMLKSLPNYPALKQHYTVWNDFSDFWCFYSKVDCIAKLKDNNRRIMPGLVSSKDWSIIVKFGDIKKGRLKYNGSSFLKHKLADVGEYQLPESYIVICPYSTDKRLKERDFTDSDWKECYRYLERTGTKAVVLNEGKDVIPVHSNLIDLSNKTTLPKAIEVLKNAKGYVGIDSSLSVLAAKLFDEPQLVIKSCNQHCYENAVCYYAPKTEFGFLANKISISEEMN